MSPRRPSLAALVALASVCCWICSDSAALAAKGLRKVDTYEPLVLKNGLVLPYPMDNLFRGWARCRGGRHTHRALDIGGVGKHWGVGTPVRAIAKMRIRRIGTPETSPEKYGSRLISNGTVKRGHSKLPCSKHVDDYGKVYFFTRNYGRHRSGVIVTAKVLEGKLKGHTVRYLHLAAPHPKVKRGLVVQAGQEIGLMGGTAVQEDPPHVHFEILTAAGEKLDPGPLLGIGSTIPSCKGGEDGAWETRKRYSSRAKKLMARLRRQAARRPPLLPGDRTSGNKARAVASKDQCGVQKVKLAFKSRWTSGKRWVLKGLGRRARKSERWILRIRTDGSFKPRLELSDDRRALFAGNWASRKDKRAYKFKLLKSGKQGDLAELEFRPQRDDLVVMTRAWQKKKRRREDRKFWLPNNAGFTIEIERPCGG